MLQYTSPGNRRPGSGEGGHELFVDRLERQPDAPQLGL
jgi:hypothetical protein